MDRRRHQRFTLSMPTVIRNGGIIFTGHIANISEGGAYIQSSDVPISLDKPVEIIFSMPGGAGEISLIGTPRHTNGKSGTGIQFSANYTPAHKTLRNYLSRLAE